MVKVVAWNLDQDWDRTGVVMGNAYCLDHNQDGRMDEQDNHVWRNRIVAVAMAQTLALGDLVLELQENTA